MIDLRKLKSGNKILLETKECIFELEVINPDNGYVNITGGKRFLLPTLANVIGAYGNTDDEPEERIVKELCIDRNYGLQIHYVDKDDISSDLITSIVLSAKIIGEGWEYEVWESKDKHQLMSQALEEARARKRVVPNKEIEENNENPDL